MVEIKLDNKKITVLEDRLYSKKHCWAKETKGVVTVGLTDFAIKSLGELVTCDLAGLKGKDVEVSDDPIADINVESSKAIGDIFSPCNGNVVEINGALENSPTTVNDSPYAEGWLFKVKASNWVTDKAALMDSAAYLKLLQKK